jgi:hypothetical protein
VEIHALTAQVSRENHHYPIKSQMIGARLFVPNFRFPDKGQANRVTWIGGADLRTGSTLEALSWNFSSPSLAGSSPRARTGLSLDPVLTATGNLYDRQIRPRTPHPRDGCAVLSSGRPIESRHSVSQPIDPYSDQRCIVASSPCSDGAVASDPQGHRSDRKVGYDVER